MNRRNFLNNLKSFAYFYGISNILSTNSFAQAANKKYLINFCVKYTGGTTDANGPGYWTTDHSLAALKPFESDLLTPMGFNIKFDHKMNAHHVNATAALAGATTEVVEKINKIGNQVYYHGNRIENMGADGAGKSIDVIVGNHLKNQFNTALPYLSMTGFNRTGSLVRSTSTWDNFKRVFAIAETSALASEIKKGLDCYKGTTTDFSRQLAALKMIKNNQDIFKSKYLIDKNKFDNLEQMTQKNLDHFEKLNRKGNTQPSLWATQPICNKYPTKSYSSPELNSAILKEKMDEMYDLSIIALKANVTRVLTFNMVLNASHAESHYSITSSGVEGYVNTSKNYHESVASFLTKLKASGLYDDAMIYCHSGSGHHYHSHHFDNQSVYLINSGKSGVAGNVSDPIGLSSLLRAIMLKYGVNMPTYGGLNYQYASLKPVTFI